MKTEYRIIFTSTFDTAAERDKAYASLKSQIVDVVSKASIAKVAHMTKDEYAVPEIATATEKVI